MTNAKITENPPYFDNEEQEIIEEFEKSLDEGTLVLRLTPERKAKMQTSARYTLASPNPMDRENERAWRQEIDKRLHEIDTGTVTCIPWEEVRERLYRNVHVRR